MDFNIFSVFMAKKKKFAMILSGCGGMDGTESHEAIALMIAIKQIGAEYMCFAINENQKYVIHANQETGIRQPREEKRNMLIEAGRLNHGAVHDLKKLIVNQFDGLVLPGGYGTGTSLSNFIICNGKTCEKNMDYKVRDEIKNIVQGFHEQRKPIFAGCMAPIMINGSLTGVKIMTDVGFYTKNAIEKKGNIYQVCKAGEVCIDEENKIITAPFYMTPKVDVGVIYDESIKGMKEMIKLCD